MARIGTDRRWCDEDMDEDMDEDLEVPELETVLYGQSSIA